MNTAQPTLLKRLAVLVIWAITVPAMAAYPEKPVRIIVPFPAGGPSDAAARAISPGIAQELKQAVIVENQPGAAGAIAAQSVLRAPADGHTLLWAVASMGVLPFIQSKPAYKSLSDFTPVSTIASFSYGLFVHPEVPAQTVAELVSHAKANPGKLSYATAAPGEHIAAAQFIHQTKVDMLRVPYKGGAQALPDLLAGRVQVYFTPLQLGLAHARSGKLRLLATLTTARNSLTPNVPTLDEAGVRGVNVPTWQGLLAPPNLPAPIATQIANAIAVATGQAGVKAQYNEQGTVLDVRSLGDFDRQLHQENDLWRRFVDDNGIPRE